MTTKEQAAMQQALEALENYGIDGTKSVGGIKCTEAITALKNALKELEDAHNKVSDHIVDAGKLIPQFIPVGIVNDHHSITWMEEIVEDQAPIGAILYALQDSVGRNVSFAKEQK